MILTNQLPEKSNDSNFLIPWLSARSQGAFGVSDIVQNGGPTDSLQSKEIRHPTHRIRP